jgi:hypothetical protein
MGERHGRTGSPGDEAPAPASPPMHRLEGFASATRYKRVQAGPSGSKRVQAGPSGSKRVQARTPPHFPFARKTDAPEVSDFCNGHPPFPCSGLGFFRHPLVPLKPTRFFTTGVAYAFAHGVL